MYQNVARQIMKRVNRNWAFNENQLCAIQVGPSGPARPTALHAPQSACASIQAAPSTSAPSTPSGQHVTQVPPVHPVEIHALRIGTHSGKFHADEAFACWMLTQLPELRGATVLRTRDATLLDQCAIVVDVGGVYSHDTCRYDHHQRCAHYYFTISHAASHFLHSFTYAGESR